MIEEGVTWRDYVDMRFADMDKATSAALAAAEKAVASALASAQEATTKAEEADDKRFASVNEFRAQQTELIGTFLPRAEGTLSLSNLNQRIATLEAGNERRLGQSTGTKVTANAIVVSLGVLLTLLSIAAVVIALVAR